MWRTWMSSSVLNCLATSRDLLPPVVTKRMPEKERELASAW